MRNNQTHKWNMTIVIMVLAFGLYAPSTFANTGPTSFNLDTFFGHQGPPDYTEEMHDSEWPTEEQPGDPAPSVPAMNMHKEDPYS